jgi:hypothetical protein
MQKIREDLPVFLHDGEVSFGAIRRVSPLVVYVEGSGDFEVPAAAVHDVHFDKVLIDIGKVDARLRAAIEKAHKGEDKDNSVTRATDAD